MHQWPHRPQAHSRHDRCHKEKGYEILIQNPSHQLAILEEQTARSAVHESEISSGTGNNHQNTYMAKTFHLTSSAVLMLVFFGGKWHRIAEFLSCCLNSKRVQVGVVKFSTSFI
jgi:hypothetical protein